MDFGRERFDEDESREEEPPPEEQEDEEKPVQPDAKVLKAQKRQKREEVASASLDRVYAAAAAADQTVRGGTQRKKRDRAGAPKSPPKPSSDSLRELVKSVHAEDSRKRSASDSEEEDESSVKLGHAARSLLDLYEGECLPLAAELKSASKQAAQTVARVRAYRRRTHTHEDVSSEDEDDEASLKTAATAGRLAALAGALAARKEVEWPWIANASRRNCWPWLRVTTGRRRERRPRL